MTLTGAVIATTFGRGSRQPLRSGYSRLCLLGLAGCSMGLVLAHSLPSLPASNTAPQLLFCMVLLATQLCLAVAVLLAAGLLSGTSDSLYRLLVFLPLPSYRRWLLIYLPDFILVGLTLLLTSPALFTLGTSLGLPVSACCLAVILGSLSVLGLRYGSTRQSASIAALCIYLVLATGLLRMITQGHPSAIVDQWLLPAVYIGSALLAAGVFASSGWRFSPRGAANTATCRLLLGPRCWMITKLGRHRGIRLSLAVSFLLSSGAAIILHHYSLATSSFLGLIATLLVASCMADSRSSARRQRPFEIAGLKGAVYFGGMLFSSNLALTCLATSPLLISMPWSSDYAWSVLAQILLGGSAGFAASVAIAPAARDISSQFTTSLLALAIVWGLPRFSYGHTVLLPVLSSGLLLAGAVFIEYKRNTYTWGTYAS